MKGRTADALQIPLGANTVITFESNNIIALQNVVVVDLQAGDVLLLGSVHTAGDGGFAW